MDDVSKEAARRAQLGEFLRAKRAQLLPEAFGFPRHDRRRVAGLLRSEVAELAAVSDTWYTWLEQGRNIRVSSPSMDSVLRALQLDPAAQEYARRLADLPVHSPSVDETLPDEFQALVDDFMPFPATLVTSDFTLVTWNEAHVAICGDPSSAPEFRNNALLNVFLNPEFRRWMPEWEESLPSVLAQFRFESAKYPGDRRFADLIAELSAASEIFKELWWKAEVLDSQRRGLLIRHPAIGELRFTDMQFRPLQYPTLILTTNRPADAATRTNLRAYFATLHQETIG